MTNAPLADHEFAGEARGAALLREQLRTIHCRLDRFFAGMLFAQWLACIAAAVWLSPRAWEGVSSATHIHVWSAVFLGGAIVGLPILLGVKRPGQSLTRHVIATAQMLTSALLIHLTGGRIETHFHIFGSLALLAAYRDWRVLLTSTAVVAIDHAARGALWPQSVYGVLSAAPWRTLEHAGWVLFEDIFLIVTIRQGISEMRNIAFQQAELEATNKRTEALVRSRTSSLQRAEQRMRLIIDSVPNGLVLIDREGRVQLANPRMEALFGYSTEELLGNKIELLVPEQVRQRHPALRDEFMRSPEVRAMGQGRDLKGVRKDGSEFPVELGLNPLATNEGLFVLAAVVDITERKRSELELKEYAARMESANAELIQAQRELEQKNQELDEFTYVASHDLQEPVRKLVSFSKLLEQDLGDGLSEQASRDLKFIVDAAARMRQLIQDLLTLSRAGRGAMKSDVVSLDECRQRAMFALQMRVEESGAEIRWEALPEALGDPTMLTQLYQNLIGNALKFVDQSPPRLLLTVEDGGENWILGVKDNGIGMKREHVDRIFKPFQRLHRRDEYEGTGIGLAICRKTVERHNGELWVESCLGEGSHFKFTLPKLPENPSCPIALKTLEEELQSC